jgi:hypothetical protein
MRAVRARETGGMAREMHLRTRQRDDRGGALPGGSGFAIRRVGHEGQPTDGVMSGPP